MRRNPHVKQMWTVALALPLCGLAVGCAARRPVAELARADQAVLHAQTTSDAASVAPAELATAQAKLTGARRAMADGNDAIARDLADQARAYAELAEEKAEAQRTTAGAARHTLSEVEVIQAESAASPDTVVVERRTVTRTAPAAVVVERPAPQSVVIEHAPPPPAPVNVVVERPASGVVVEHDPPVVVLPE